MIPVNNIAALEAIYGSPAEASLIKVADHITPLYHTWIMASRLCVLSTVGPSGTDASPRGDDGPVVRIADAKTLYLPDWRGNNRMDSLRNIVTDGRVSLMFFVLGSHNVTRINGSAIVTTDHALCQSFDNNGRHPRSVIVITVNEVYSQCARALMRAGIWAGHDHTAGLPTVGALLAEAKAGFNSAEYDRQWASRAAETLW